MSVYITAGRNCGTRSQNITNLASYPPVITANVYNMIGESSIGRKLDEMFMTRMRHTYNEMSGKINLRNIESNDYSVSFSVVKPGYRLMHCTAAHAVALHQTATVCRSQTLDRRVSQFILLVNARRRCLQ